MSKIDFKSTAIGALSVAVVALGVNAIGARNNDALLAQIKAEIKNEVTAGVSQGIKDNPKILVETIQAYMQSEQDRQARDRDQQAVERKAEIAKADGLPFIGNPEGAVQIVYFFDANCVYCKRMDPVLKQVVAENPDVKVIHREIPILTETSRLAAQIGNVVWQFHPDRYAELHDRFLAHEGALTEESIEDYLTLVLGSENSETVLARAKNPQDDSVHRANDRIKGNLRLASDAGVTGTPFLYVVQGDGIVRGAGENAHEQVTSLVRKGRESAR